MKFKSMTTVNNNYAVLATRKEHYHELCYDRKLDDCQFFWAVLDGGDEHPDEIVLVELDETGRYEVCEAAWWWRRSTVPSADGRCSPNTMSTTNPPLGRIALAAAID